MNKKNLLIITGLVLLATSWRIINHSYGLAPNLELVTVISVMAALTIGWQAAVIAPLATMALSDAVIGTSPIILVTWSCFGLIGSLAMLLRRFSRQPGRQLIASVGFAFMSSTLFYLVTNFGVWLFDFNLYYPGTLAGLGSCLAMGIPFYRTMLIGNLLIVPTAVGLWQLARLYLASRHKASMRSID
ncbi:MAG: DUF6580 family putative transport protein [Candidatus Saccharibacteria bacterium]